MEIPSKRIRYRGGDKFVLKPLFDVHLGNSACDEYALKSYIQDSDEATYFIIGGDFLDSIITSDLKRYRKTQDTTESNAIVDEQVERGAAFLWPIKDQLLGIGAGNHEDEILKRCGTDPTKRLCKALGAQYLGYSGIYVLQFTHHIGGRGRTVVIRYHHGWAGGRTEGGQLTSNSHDLKYWDADIFLFGHGHACLTKVIPRISVAVRGNTTKMYARDRHILLCGTFLKTYIVGDTTYSEKKGYPPIKVGQAYLTIKPDNNWCSVKSHTF